MEWYHLTIGLVAGWLLIQIILYVKWLLAEHEGRRNYKYINEYRSCRRSGMDHNEAHDKAVIKSKQ